MNITSNMDTNDKSHPLIDALAENIVLRFQLEQHPQLAVRQTQTMRVLLQHLLWQARECISEQDDSSIESESEHGDYPSMNNDFPMLVLSTEDSAILDSPSPVLSPQPNFPVDEPQVEPIILPDSAALNNLYEQIQIGHEIRHLENAIDMLKKRIDDTGK